MTYGSSMVELERHFLRTAVYGMLNIVVVGGCP